MTVWPLLPGRAQVFPYAWLFFVPFMLIASFAVLNLFIGIIVDAMRSQARGDVDTPASTNSRPEPTLADLQAEIRALRDAVTDLKRD